MRRKVWQSVWVFALTMSFATTAAHSAHADEIESRAAWTQAYEAARTEMIDGHFDAAESAFRALAQSASNEADKQLAMEMARLSATYAKRSTSPKPAIRTTDELALLYGTAFFYGVGTGAWYVLQAQPESALTATLPFAILTAAPVAAVATVDGYKKLPRGVPHSISAGIYLGFGEGIWLTAFEHARSSRIEAEDPRASIRWGSKTISTVLWSGASLGGILGGVLGTSLVTTPGRVSFTVSRSLWAGTISGLTAGALLPEDARRSERAYGIAGLGYNVGLGAGLLFAGEVSPTVTRVRIVDLVGLAGTVSAGGLYLGLAKTVDIRAAEGFAAAGAVLGLATGWLATSGMAPELPGHTKVSTVTIEPSIAPVAGGATIGVVGAM